MSDYRWFWDNPAARGEPGGAAWLADNPNSLTAGFHDAVETPVRQLAGLPGARGEHFKPDPARVAELAASIRERGFDPNKAPLVIVDWRGDPHVYEGNRRIAAAALVGLETIPVEVRYEGGSECLAWAWHPSTVVLPSHNRCDRCESAIKNRAAESVARGLAAFAALTPEQRAAEAAEAVAALRAELAGNSAAA